MRCRGLHPVRGLASFCFWAATAACTVGPLDLNGRPCGEEGCLANFDCHPELALCVQPVEVDCDSPTAYCPERVSTNDPCPSVDSFIPCNNSGTECCRTCGEDLRWSICTPRECQVGAAEICDDRDNNCNDFVDEGIFACRCSFADPIAELCNGIDDDCNDGIDDTFACELGELQECDAGPGPRSGTRACDAACRWETACLPKDRTPPGRLRNLAATAAHQRLGLSWQYPVGLDLSLCVLQRAETGFPANAEQGVRAFATTNPTPNGMDNHLDTGLTNAVTYFYAGFCRDTSGNWNEEVFEGDSAVIAAPTAGVPDNPTDFDAADDLDRRTVLSFTMPPEPVVRCHVLRRADGSFATGHADANAILVGSVLNPNPVLPLVDLNLINDTTYAYAVFCDNNEHWNDTVSTAVNTRNADTATPRDPLPGNPIDLVATAGDAAVTLTFTMPTTTLTRCELRRSSSTVPANHNAGSLVSAFSGTGGQTYLDVGLTNGTTYTYAVFCLNGTRWNDAVDEFPAPNNVASATPADVALQRLTSQSAAVQDQTTILTGNLNAGANVLHLAAVATRPNRAVSGMTGGGLTWSPVANQCSGLGSTGIELWSAFGSTDIAFQVRVVLEGAANSTVVVTPYLGANPATPLGNVGRSNANGQNGGCTGGSEQSSWSVGVTRRAGAWAYAAVNLHDAADQSHTEGSGLNEVLELHANSGSNRIGSAVIDTSNTSATLSGTIGTGIGSDIDWAAIGVEILP